MPAAVREGSHFPARVRDQCQTDPTLNAALRRFGACSPPAGFRFDAVIFNQKR